MVSLCRRQPGKTGLKTLHPSTFLVNADQQVLANSPNAIGQRHQLVTVVIVPGKQDNAGNGRGGKQLLFLFSQLLSLQIHQHDARVFHHYLSLRGRCYAG